MGWRSAKDTKSNNFILDFEVFATMLHNLISFLSLIPNNAKPIENVLKSTNTTQYKKWKTTKEEMNNSNSCIQWELLQFTNNLFGDFYWN